MRNPKIYSLTKEQLQSFLDSSGTIKEILEKIGVKYFVGNQRDLKTVFDRNGINYDKLKLHYTKRTGKKHPRLDKRDLTEILIENSDYTSTHMKKRLLREGLLDYKCNICGLVEWIGKPISLELDHINGNHHDNRIENLRILCPNCHSQCTTEGAKNSKRRAILKHCSACGGRMDKYSLHDLCRKCRPKGVSYPKKEKPSKESLLAIIKQEGGFVGASKKIGVGRGKIREWYKSYFPEEYRNANN